MKNLFAKILLVSVLISLFAGCVQQAPTENIATPTTHINTINKTNDNCFLTCGNAFGYDNFYMRYRAAGCL